MSFKQMKNTEKIKWCVITNFALLVLFITILDYFGSNSTHYWTYGPSENLHVISVHINSWKRYWILLGFIALFRVSEVVIGEIAHPILDFSIYNPDKTEIYDFTRNQLQLYANSLYLVDSIRKSFTIMITISQLDIALFGSLVGEIASFFTIRMLLNQKTFPNQKPEYELV